MIGAARRAGGLWEAPCCIHKGGTQWRPGAGPRHVAGNRHDPGQGVHTRRSADRQSLCGVAWVERKAELRFHASEAVRQSLRVAGRTATQIRRGVRARNDARRTHCRGDSKDRNSLLPSVRAPAGGLPSRTRVITPVWLDSGLTRWAHTYVPNVEHTHSLTRDVKNGTERDSNVQ